MFWARKKMDIEHDPDVTLNATQLDKCHGDAIYRSLQYAEKDEHR